MQILTTTFVIMFLLNSFLSQNSTWLNEMKSCPRTQPCKHCLYDFVEVDITSSGFVDTSLELQIGNKYVIYVIDFVGYDFQSFFGEIGGTLGFLLGISLASIFDFLYKLFSPCTNRVRLLYGGRYYHAKV